MGNIALAMASLCQALKIPYVMPEKNNKTTLQTGAYYSPEEICLPFKLILGNFIEAIKKGADTILMVGSCGPCRFGEYCELQMKILQKMELDRLDFIVADLSSEVGPAEFRRRIGRIADASPVRRADKLRALKTALDILILSDKLDAAAHYRAGYEANRGDCRRLLSECKNKAYASKTPEETTALLKQYKKKLDSVRTADRHPIRVALIGEIFTIIEPFSNLYIEDKLMDYGVSTTRMLTPSWWLKNMALKPLGLYARRVYRASDAYMPFPVGGHGKECVGEAVLAQAHGLDGAIQIFPLGCMPEVIAKSILPAVREDRDFPVMTLIVDEVTGEAGYMTRIEAFLDMLAGRKRKADLSKPTLKAHPGAEST
jgi:predicted nucleotide-binding protein (sugar kinase/HSP70/actin superfamily)